MRLSLLRPVIFAFSLAACGGSDNAPDPSTDDSSPDGGTASAPSTVRDAGHTSSTSGSSTSGSSTSGSSSSVTATSGTSGNGTTVRVGTVAKDGGTVTVVSASTDGGASDDSLGIGDIFGTDSDGGTTMSSSDGSTPDSCENAVCFDVFDCAVWHLDALDCGFTACENFVCVK